MKPVRVPELIHLLRDTAEWCCPSVRTAERMLVSSDAADICRQAADLLEYLEVRAGSDGISSCPDCGTELWSRVTNGSCDLCNPEAVA